jgi:plasmid stability protein
LTLDDDVAAKLKAEARRDGRAFKEVVNDILRRGLSTRPVTAPAEPFKVKARDLGNVQPGTSLDNVAELLDRIEGSRHR